MIFTKDLLLKGLAGLAVCGGATTIGVHYYTGGFSSSSNEVKVTEKDLGLPEGCTFSGAITTPCNLTADNIGTIKFDGKTANQNPTFSGTGTQSATLQISKDADFPHGYLFTVSVPSTSSGVTLTINRDGGNISITSTNPVDFKIKQNAGNTFSLEKAWTEEDLAKKLRLNKEEDGRWTLGTEAIKVKHDSTLETKTVSSNQPGKIKAVADTTYNKGTKFVIEDGDIALTGEGSTITKLEQFETYEIKKEESNGWVLVRKSKASEEIKKALGLPTENCNMPEGNTSETECTSLDQTKITAIKFEGKGEGNVTVDDNTFTNIKLKISKTTETNKTDFPYGFKFILESDKDITIPKATGSNPSTIIIKKGTNTEFKIKKEENSNDLTLEKAWTVETLGKKINLTNCTTAGDASTKQCDFGSSINVYDSATSKVTGAAIATTGKKITYLLDQDNYNQGIKFTVGEDISITATATSGGTIPTQISNSGGAGTPSYEIKEIEGTWYLAKKGS